MDVTTFDVERARRDTPGTANVAHLNNAGAALPPTQVTDAVVAHLRREAEIGGYEAAAEAHEQVEHTYDAIARLIGCQILRDRDRGERHSCLGHGLLRALLRARRPDPDCPGRVLQQRHRLPPGRRAHRRRRRGRRQRRVRAALRGATCAAGSPTTPVR